MLDREIYQRMYNGEITRSEALKLVLMDLNKKSEKIELSESQKGIWAVCKMFPDSYAYNTPGAIEVSSDIDIEILKKALEQLSDFHASLRTVILHDGNEPYQAVKEQGMLEFSQINVWGLTEEDITESIMHELKRPFNLEEGPLMRACIFDVSKEKKILLFNFHHIVFDGISSRIFMEELKECYYALKEGHTHELRVRRANYAGFIEAEKRYLQSAQAVKDREYWLNQLSGEIPVLELPVDKKHPFVNLYEGTSYTIKLDKELVNALKELNTSNHATLFSIMIAAFKVLLFRYSGQNNLFIGTPVAGRYEQKYEDVIGCFINMMVVKSVIDFEDSLISFIERVQQIVLEGLEHSKYPYHKLVKELNQINNFVDSGLFQVAFYFQNWIRETNDKVFREQLHDIHQLGEFDLTLEVIETEEECILHFKYNPDMFSKDIIQYMASHYKQALGAIVENPKSRVSQIVLLNNKERETLITEWNNTFQEYDQNKTFPDLFAQQVQSNPFAIAVIFKDQVLTYIELYKKARKLAGYMQQKGVKKGELVGILLERGIDLMVALIATQMSGGIYVPLDPIYPADRLSHMFEEGQMKFVLSTSSLEDHLPVFEFTTINLDKEAEHIDRSMSDEKAESMEPLCQLDPKDLVYTIFTSGSTGKPKGIMVYHGGLVNFLCSMAKKPGCTSQDYILAVTTICFDIAALELYLPLITGAKVEILPDEIAKDGIMLLEHFEASEVTIMQATPATWQMLIAAGWKKRKNFKVLCGGEALPSELAEKLISLSEEVWNLYGPTETTIWSSTDKVEKGKKISLGLPIANTQFYILDTYLNPVPIGVAGELYIGGDGVAKGYINREEETERKFIKNPFIEDSNSRIFKTGDLARYRTDGTVEYMGRADFQVKIRGFRVELGEIETALNKVNGISEVVVVLRKDGDNSKSLVAFVIADDIKAIPTVDSINKVMENELPDYMIPSNYFFLKAYPLTLNSKISRKELSEQELSILLNEYGAIQEKEESPKRPIIRKEPQATRSKSLINNYVERFIINEMANIKNISPETIKSSVNMGEYGFDSISFTSLSLKINKHYGVKTNPTLFYTYPTVDRFTEFLTANYLKEINSKEAVMEEVEVKHRIDENIASETTKKPDELNNKSNNGFNGDIAIVGMSGMLPGSDDLQSFWNNILEEKDLVTVIPPDRWDWKEYYDELNEGANKSNSKWGGFIKDIDKFDAAFFGISPREAELMDPQQRLMLQVVWAAIEDAGYKPSDLSGTDTGVFVGATGTDYSEFVLRESEVDAHTVSGIVNAVIPNRVSYFFNFKGPSELIDTACSSTLVGVSRAVASIRSGECGCAIVGGVNLIISPFAHIALSKISMLSKDGKCKAFDKDGNGYVRGEGCAAIILKPLDKAIEDKDHIYAVIKGVAVNHGGRTNSLTAPNPNAQKDLIKKAIIDSGIDPYTIGYIEAHGTGTALGDPIEINGLKSAFSEIYEELNCVPREDAYCGIGSVKTNIGHLEAMAGLAGLLKVTLSLYHHKILATIHCRELNPFINVENSPFYIARETQEWKHPKDRTGKEAPLHGGVSSFGMGGTNAHIVLEEYKESEKRQGKNSNPVAIVFSARDNNSLKNNVEKFVDYLRKAQTGDNSLDLNKIAFTLQIGREAMKERLALVVNTVDELLERLEMYLNGTEQIINMFTSTDRNIKEALELVLDGAELEEFVERKAEKGDILKVASLWTNGADINWNLLYKGNIPGRISLPSYQFKKDRHWVPMRQKYPKYGKSSDWMPLIDKIIPEKSLGQGLVFKKTLRNSELIVKDHKVNSQCVFPGTGYIETVVEAISLLTKGNSYTLRNITWLQPLVVEDGECIDINLSLKEEGKGFKYEIESVHQDGNILHSKGDVYCDMDEQFNEEYLYFDDIKLRCSEEIKKDTFYKSLADNAGIEYGLYFQGVQELWSNEKEVLGHFILPEGFESELNDYCAHPVIMDCALQLMGCLLGRNTDKGKAKIPFMVEEVNILDPLRSREYYAYVVNESSNIHNIAIVSKDGKVCVKFYHVTSRELKTQFDRHIYCQQWVEYTAENTTKEPHNKTEKALVLYNDEAEYLKEKIINTMDKSNVTQAQLYFETSRTDGEWKIGFNDIQGYINFILENNIKRIYFLGAISRKQADGILELEKKQKYGVYALFYLVKALSQIGSNVQLVVVTNNIFEVLPSDSIISANSGVSGFVKAAALEYQNIEFSLVDIEYNESISSSKVERQAHLLTKMVKGTPEVTLRNETFYTRKIRGLYLPYNTKKSFRTNGVYVIVGAGGIGLELGLYLAKKYKARIALIGRSNLNEIKKSKIDSIKEYGGEAIYIQADVTDFDSMKKVVTEIEDTYGVIHGIFNCVMVLNDKRIENMTEDVMREVCAPKVKGSVILYDVVKDKKLDFLVNFSSTNAFIGNVGQSNYNCACSFQDAFALSLKERAGFPIKIINWSFWGNVGVVASEEYRSLLNQKGLLSIEPFEGMAVLEAALSSPISQVVMFKATDKLLSELGFDFNNKIEIYSQTVPSVIENIELKDEPAEEKIYSIKYMLEGFSALEEFAVCLLLKYFQLNRYFTKKNEKYSKRELINTLGIIPSYERLFDALIYILEKSGLLLINEDKIESTELVEDYRILDNIEKIEEKKRLLDEKFSTLSSYTRLLWTCVSSFADVLTGRIEYTEVMFPEGSKDLVQSIYKGNLIIDYYNELVAEFVRNYIKERLDKCKTDHINILEIGSGTGGTSEFVLEKVKHFGKNITYYYTDISASFTSYGKAKYGSLEFVDFKVLDIEKLPEMQDFQLNSIDIVFATNVLHATSLIQNTLGNIKRLLKANGVIVINEIVRFQNFSTLTFGLTGGWWNSKDTYRITGSPLLNVASWKNVLEICGYYNIAVAGLKNENKEYDQCIITAVSNGITVKKADKGSVVAALHTDKPVMVAKEEIKHQKIERRVVEDNMIMKRHELNHTELIEETIKYLKDKLAKVLKIESNNIGNDEVFQEIGVDSLITVEFNKELVKDFGKVPATLLFEYTTLAALAGYFCTEQEEKLKKLFRINAKPVDKPVEAKKDLNWLFKTTTSELRNDIHQENQENRENQENQENHENRENQRREKAHTTTALKDIAIIGLSGKYPLAETLEEYWENLKQGRNCITEIPRDRWDWEKYYDPSNSEQGKGYSKWGGFISDIDKFDAEFFDISDEHAVEMDPQERIFLENTWTLLEDAGYPGKTLANKGEKVGLFVGIMYGGYGQIATKAWENGIRTNAQSAYWIIPNRVSYHFNFTGPSIAIDTACSSSLTAIHYACKSIERGECSVAVAGGINLILNPRQHVRLSNLNSLTRDGRNKCFSENADGFAEGEGVGAILLKPLEDAIRDNDYIYGVIKGSAINSGGESNGFTAPSLTAQMNVSEDALKDAGINPETVSYIEAHATGTVLGDPVEINALSKVFSKYTAKKQFCTVGTVKANIGHLEAASGMSAITKVLLQMKYGKIVPSINIDKLNPYIELENTPFYFQEELGDWKQNTYFESGQEKTLPRRAGISSFGAGGSNAHIIVEEYKRNLVTSYLEKTKYLIILSAKKQESLYANAKALLLYIQNNMETGQEKLLLSQIEYTLQIGRMEMKERLALVVTSLDDLKDKLKAVCNGEVNIANVYKGSALKCEKSGLSSYENSINDIAMHWVSGTSFNWELFYQNEVEPCRIPLPTYCFNRQRYWLDDEESLIKENLYSASFQYDEPYLRDHVSFGKRVLLGVTYCSIAYEALKCVGDLAPVVHFHNFQFVESVELNVGENVEVTAELVSEDERLFINTRVKKSFSKNFETAARSEVIRNTGTAPYMVKIHSFKDMNVIKTEEMYNKKPGVYGESLFTIKEAFALGNEAWGELALTREMINSSHSYSVHPALLDGAVLCRLALSKSTEPDLLIPLMVKEMYIYSELPVQCYCHLTEVKVNSEIWEGDIEIIDKLGKVLILMKGFVCKKVWIDEEHQPLKTENAHLSQYSESNNKIVHVVEQYLISKIASMLKTDSYAIDEGSNFMSMGVDSVRLINLTKELQKDLGVELYPTLFFEYQNIRDLAEYLAEEYPNKFSKTDEVSANHNIAAQRNFSSPVKEPKDSSKEDSGLRQLQGKDYKDYKDDSIAIIGFSGIMPQADDLDDFWKKIIGEECLITTIPEDRWDWRKYYKESPDDTSKTNVIWGGFMKEVDKFDATFFGISPREANLMDPQQRLVLELAWKAIEDAGYNPKELSGSKTGVFIGVAGHDYHDIVSDGAVDSKAQSLTGNAHNIITGRISYILNLHGPSEPLDNACASSLVSINRAVQCLRNGDCDMALAGGVNVIASPSLYISFDNVGILSQDGKCKVFDKDANGTVRGEGAGLLLLKPLNRAIEDNDHIYAVIKASAVNHGGHGNSLTAPNPKQQAEVIFNAYEKSEIDPSTITYIESHGTGTTLGDPVEINGLKSAFKKLYSKWGKSGFTTKGCGIGALKSNIGHLETAAGIAGVIKVLLCMKHGVLPGIVNLKELNPYIQLEDSPFYIVEKTQLWQRLKDTNGDEIPYRAGISAFGFSGVNAHVVLEEYRSPAPAKAQENRENLIILSAQNEERLVAYAESLSAFLKRTRNLEKNCGTMEPKIIRDVIAVIAQISDIDEKDIDDETSLLECGFDAAKLSMLVNELNKCYNLELSLSSISIENCPKDITQILGSSNSITNYYSYSLDNSSGSEVEKQDISLSQVAYTLQKGREVMDERIAFVVSNIEELIEKLDKFISGERNIYKVFTGRKQEERGKLDLILEGDLGIEIISKIAARHELEKLAQLWVAGVKISNWDVLYHEKQYKIPLPTYPFTRQHYWVERVESTNSVALGKGVSQLTPLLDSNESTLEKQSYKKTLTQEEFYLKDHMVNGSIILPGVIYLEMARMAGELAFPKKEVIGLNNIVWAKPLQLHGNKQDAFIDIYSKEDEIAYEINSGDETVYSQGVLVYGSFGEIAGEKIDIEAVKQRCSKHMQHKEFYELFRQSGFNYGSSFMPIEEIYHNEHEALSGIKLPVSVLSTADSFMLHPSLLEGGLQTAGYIINRDAGATSPYIPFAIEKIDIYEKLPECCYGYAVQSQELSDNETMKIMDVFLVDDQGRVLVKIKKYIARPVEKKDREETVYFSKVWKQIKEKSNRVKGSVLLFDKDKREFDYLIEKGMDKVYLVKSGTGFKNIQDNILEMDPTNENNYIELFRCLKDKGVEYENIVNLWSQEDFTYDEVGLKVQMEHCLYPLFYISRALLKQKQKNTIRLLYIHGINKPLCEGISGFNKSINLENNKLIFRSIGIEGKEEDIASIILSELFEENIEPEVRYRGAIREVKALEVLKPEVNGEALIKVNGVYIITGGLGGVGFAIAQNLASKYRAKLVLVGRSEITEDSRLKELEATNTDFIYLRGDVSNRTDVERIVDGAKARFGCVNGIIHCAGLIKDSLVINKSINDLNEVIAPKVYGTINLDWVTRDEKLDFIALFSSISGEIGNLGQSDYAYANSFMDNFASYRENLRKQGERHGKTVSINWPLWQDGGIAVDDLTKKLMESTLYIKPLENSRGFNILEKCLSRNMEQIMVMHGNRRKINTLFAKNIKEDSVILNIDENDLLKKLIDDLSKSVSKISRIKESEISFAEELDKYGFDSITLTEFTNELNFKFSFNITPAVFYEISELTINNLGKHLLKRNKNDIAEHYTSSTDNNETIVDEEDEETEVAFSGMNIKNRFKPLSCSDKEITDIRHTVDDDNYEPIAIIGIGGVMPQSENLDEFWKHIVGGDDLITEVPPERWDWRDFYGDPNKEEGKSTCKWGGFMKEVDKFDALFFNLSPQEAKILDPQQRMFLETTWKTIEDSGYKPSVISGTNTGVFIGVTNNEYAEILRNENVEIDGHSITSNAHFLIANRISYFYNLHGPSETIDTACSSAAVAIHRAVTSLHTGECELAIAGGVNMLLSPRSNISFDKAGMLSKDGRCKTFDKSADGFVRGEGIGALLLKPLKKAEADKDPIYAVIRGSAVKHGGRSKSFVSPNPNGQIEVVKAAINKSGINPLDISYIETHGTGSAIGDNVEVEGLKGAFRELLKSHGEEYAKSHSCGLGSVKTNIGNLEAASGIASILKVVLAMKYKTLPPSIHCKEVNPFLKLEDSPFYIIREKKHWDRITDKDGRILPRYAGVNVFGAGGVNVHIILEEYERTMVADNNKEPVVVVFSAKNKTSLYEIVAQTAEYIKLNTDINLRDIAYTLQLTREEMDERVAMVVYDVQDLINKCVGFGTDNISSYSDIYIGKIKNKNRDLIEDDNEDSKLIDIALENKQYNDLASLWVSGAKINWKKLYMSEKRFRISLPTYCFNKQIHWAERQKTDIKPVVEEDKDTISKVSIAEASGEDTIKRYLLQKISLLLGIEPESIQLDGELAEMGFDSINTIKLKSDLENEFAAEVPMALLAQSRSIDSLAENIFIKPELLNIKNAIISKMQESYLESSIGYETDTSCVEVKDSEDFCRFKKDINWTGRYRSTNDFINSEDDLSNISGSELDNIFRMLQKE